MNIEDFRDYCLSVRGAAESCPFIDKNVVVYKIMDKMFCYISLSPRDGRFRACIKCDPDRAEMLREKYAGITRGEHTTAFSWNAVYLDSDVPDTLICELVAHSVDEVIKHLPKRKQREYEEQKANT